jgi:hypothetical protein
MATVAKLVLDQILAKRSKVRGQKNCDPGSSTVQLGYERILVSYTENLTAHKP